MTPRQENPLSGVIICPNRRRTAVKAELLGPSLIVRLWRKKSTADDFNFPYETCSKRPASLPSPATILASGTAINQPRRHAQIHRSTIQLAGSQWNGRFRSLHFLAKFCA
jgi:hypothetical protein